MNLKMAFIGLNLIGEISMKRLIKNMIRAARPNPKLANDLPICSSKKYHLLSKCIIERYVVIVYIPTKSIFSPKYILIIKLKIKSIRSV
jgi:hypothetical protein